MRTVLLATLLVACGKSDTATEPAKSAGSRDAAAVATAHDAAPVAADADVRAQRQAKLDELAKTMKGMKGVVGERDDEAIFESELSDMPGVCLLAITVFYGDFVKAMNSWGFRRARCSPQMFTSLDLNRPDARLATAKWLTDEHRQAELGNRFGVHATDKAPIPFVLGADDELFVLTDCTQVTVLKIAADHTVTRAMAEHGIHSVHCLDGKSLAFPPLVPE